MRQASVGFQCPDCTSARPERVISSPTLFRGHSEVVVGKVIIGVNVAVWLLATVLGGDPMSISGPVYEHGPCSVPTSPTVTGGAWSAVRSCTPG